jgi:sugar/nucleoside kinase (ribokinase family)
MPRIAIIGELNLDFIITGAPALPRLGEEVIVGDMTLTLGSSSAILACQLAKLGDDVVFVTKAGADEFGQRALAFLAEKGVSTEFVQVIPSMRSGLTVSIAVGSERAMLTQLGTIEEMRLGDVDWERLRGCHHLHISSYYLQRNLRPDIGRVFAEAHRRGLTTSFDTGWPTTNEFHDHVREVWSHVDVFLPNETEAMQLTGEPDVEAALAALTRRVPIVAVKLGPEGAVARRGQEEVRRPGFVVEVAETTGAGDSFNGGFLHGYLAGMDLGACLDLGNACGALSARGIGGTTTQATHEEAEKFILTAPRHR